MLRSTIKAVLAISFLFILSKGIAQYNYLDEKKELESKLNKCGEDTNKVIALSDLARLTSRNNFLESYNYATKAIELSGKLGYVKGKAYAYNSLGDAFWYHADYIKAQDNYFKAYRINDSLKDQEGIANSLYNIGWIICLQQKNGKEIGYLYRSLAIYEKLGDVSGVTKLCNALGGYFGEKHATSKLKPDFDSSLSYYNKAISFLKANGITKQSYGIFYGSMGDLMAQLGDYKSAKYYGDTYLDLIRKNGDSATYYVSLASVANYELHLGNTDKAISMYEEAKEFAEKNDVKNVQQVVYDGLYECYETKGDVPNAFIYYKKAKIMQDTLNKQLFSASITDIQNSFEIEKREASIKQLQQANEIQELKAKQNKFILLGVGIVLMIIMVIAYLLYKRNQEKYAANLLLQEQNAIISQKKQEIEQSIQYAKGIQNALLPSIKEIKSVFPEGFIYYQPKDVVSGDFYWFHKLGDHFYLVAADCTGHGVPGALMSIVSMDKIGQGIFEKKLSEPKDILRFLNVEIKNSLKQHDDESKQRDGLDLALIRINIKTARVDFSAANRPLYIVSAGKITEYKADKVAIAGFTPDEHDFKQISLEMKKGDCLYMSTDGYADQFGGTESKKFMTRNFKSLLEKIHNLDMNSQERELINSHLTWKGNYEQVDDILVVGIKV
jgi:serine phosphatase RsbU (regulator of sigma subunit)